MRHYIIILLLYPLFQLAAQTCNISGNLSGTINGEDIKIILASTHRNEKPLASSNIVGNKFDISFELEAPRLMLLQMPASKNYIMVMASPNENITLTGSASNPMIKGSSLHPEFERLYIKPREEMNKKYDEIGGNDEFFKYVERRINEDVLSQKDSWWGPLLLLTHCAYLTPEAKSYYDSFSSEAKDSFYGQTVRKGLFPDVIIYAPDFCSEDRYGNIIELKDIAPNKDYLLIDFWATWCAPCRKAIPEMKDIYRKYNDKGLEIVSISIDNDVNQWINVLEEENLSWLNLIDKNDIADLYGVKAVPSVFIIERKNGKIHGCRLFGESVTEKLIEIFGF